MSQASAFKFGGKSNEAELKFISGLQGPAAVFFGKSLFKFSVPTSPGLSLVDANYMCPSNLQLGNGHLPHLDSLELDRDYFPTCVSVRIWVLSFFVRAVM